MNFQAIILCLFSMLFASLPARSQRISAPLRAETSAATKRAEIFHDPVGADNDSGPALDAMREYDDGDPTPEEQYVLELLNRMRANPAEEGKRLAATTDPDVLLYYRTFAVDTSKIVADFAQYQSRPPLAFQPQLAGAARDHTADMVAHNYQAHAAPDGSRNPERVEKYGYPYWYLLGENIYSYALSLWHAHVGMAVDWGEENRAELGHRDNMLNISRPGFIYNEVGIGVVHIENNISAPDRVGPYVITQVFADNYGVRRKYVVGVVYDDRNGNGFYDIGEGIAGATITPSRGDYYAITGISGGYAIPYTDSTGTIELTAHGGGLPATVTRSVELTNENVKVDFVQRDTPVEENYSGGNAPAIYSIDPNPITGLSIVRYSLPAESDVSLKLFDMSGHEVGAYVQAREEAGEHLAYIFPSDFPSCTGAYVLQLQAGHRRYVAKVMVAP